MIEHHPDVAIINSNNAGEHGAVSLFGSSGRDQRKRRPTRPSLGHDSRRSTDKNAATTTINGINRRPPSTPWRGRIWRENDERDKVEGRHRHEGQSDADAVGHGGAGRRHFVRARKDEGVKDEGVMTIDMIVRSCGRSLIEPSAVSAPSDFLTSEGEYRRVWQVFKTWLCSAVSAKLRAHLPRFFSLSYRVFNLGICIPTLELDTKFLQRYGLTQEQSLSSKSSASPRAPQQVTFSRDSLGKGAGLPPARAAFALESILCAVGKKAGMGRTLLVDCGVGVLAARGGVLKFTFVQGADSLEVVHRPAPPGHDNPNPSGNNKTAAARGGIHSFGKCYIPYTSQGNKELALARSRETTSLLRALHEDRGAQHRSPRGVEGEEGMSDCNLVETMRAWNPGVPPKASSTATTMTTSHASQGDGLSFSPRGNLHHHHSVTDIVGRGGIGKQVSSGRGGVAARVGASGSAVNLPAQRVPPPLIDIHARLRGVILSSPRRSNTKSAAVAGGGLEDRTGRTGPAEIAPLGLEPRGVERVGSHYSPAAQDLLLDLCRGCITWREYAGGSDSTTSLDTELLADRRRVGGRAGRSDCVDFNWRGANDETDVNATASAIVRRGGERPSGILVRASSAPCDDPGGSSVFDVEQGSRIPPAPSGMQLGENNRCDLEDHLWPSSQGRTQDSGEEAYDGQNREISSSIDRSRETEKRAGGAEQRPLVAYHVNRGSLPAVGTAAPSSPPDTQSPPPPLVSHRNNSDQRRLGCSGSTPSRPLTSAPPANPSPSLRALGLISPRDKDNVCGGDRRSVVVEALERDSAAERYQAGLERYLYYMEQDVALAESIAVLQPPSKAGIIQKALDGLKRGLNINRGINSDGETEHWEERSDDSSGEPSDSTATAEKLGVASVTAAAAGEHLRVGKQRQKPTTNGSTALRSSGGCTTRGGDQEEEDGEEEDRDVFEMDGPGTGQGSQMRPAIRSFAEPSSAVGGRSAAPVFAAASGGDATIRSGTLERASSNRGKPRRVQGAGAAVFTDAAAVEVPDALVEGINVCLEEACDTFRRSIRRAVLNYVLLDKGQRVRLGIPAVPCGFESDGWGWGKGRGFRESPPEWRCRFTRAREVLKRGQIAGSSALLAAQALLVECREMRLLRLPSTAADVWSSRWTPLTADEFRATQLRHLTKTVGRVRRLLFPGLSEALTSQLGGGSTPRYDGHVKRYLLAVNVMTASILRGLVETALSDLLVFFQIYGQAPIASMRAEGPPTVRTIIRNTEEACNWQTHHGRGAVGGARRDLIACGDTSEEKERGQVEESKRNKAEDAVLENEFSCPPAFKIFLEESSSHASSPHPELTCKHSLDNLAGAVTDVLRAVVLSFCKVPKVAYDCAEKIVGDIAEASDPANDSDGGDGGRKNFESATEPTPSGAPISLESNLTGVATVAAGEESKDFGRGSLRSETNFDGSEYECSDSHSDMDSESTSGMASIFREGEGSGAGSSKFLTVLQPYEPVVANAVKAVASCLRVGSETANTACQAYHRFRSLLSEAEEVKNRPEEVLESDLPHLADSLDRYKSAASSLRAGDDAAPVELLGKLVVVDCEETSRKLLGVAGELWKGSLQWVHFTLGRLAGDITKQARTAILRLGKRPRSATEMAEAIEYLRTTRAQEQTELRQRQVWMGQLLDFTFKHGGLHHDAVMAVSGVHRVMVELVTATEKAGKAIAEGQAQLQKGVEKARRRIEDDVESLQMRIDSSIESGGRARDMADKVAVIVQDLEALKAQAVDLGEEEVKVDGYTSGTLVALTDKAMESFKPHADVWMLVASVGRFMTTVARSSVLSLDSDGIIKDHGEMKEKLEGLHQYMTSRSHTGPARAAQEALRQLQTVEKDIPVMTALSNPRLKDRHFRKLSTLAGMTVSSDHPTTLQQLNELDVLTDAKVEAIIRLSDEADAEQVVQDKTAAVDLFVREEAVLRITVAAKKDYGDDDDDAQNNANGEAMTGVSQIDQGHLNKVITEAERWREVVAEVKLTDAAKLVAAAQGVAEEGLPETIENLEIALAELEKTGHAFLKCAVLVTQMEIDLEEERNGDDRERHDGLKSALERWYALLARRSGQSLKEIVNFAEEELANLTEAS